MIFHGKCAVCGVCGNAFECKRRRLHADGLLRCKDCKSKYNLEYHQSKWRTSTKCKVGQSKFRMTDKAKAIRRRYSQSEHGKDKLREHCRLRYWKDPEGARLRVIAYTHGVEKTSLYEIIERDKVCQLCGSDRKLQFDHIHPVSAGGKGSLDNLQLLCGPCNRFKSNNLFLPGGGMMVR